MVIPRPAQPDEFDAWYDDWSARLHAWYSPLGADYMAERRCRNWTGPGDPTLTILADDSGARVGHIATKLHENEAPDGSTAALVHDLVIAPEHRGRGHGRAALDLARRTAEGRAGAFGVLVWSDDPAATALVSGLTLRNQRMFKNLEDAVEAPLPPGASARELTEAEYEAWMERDIAGYAADMANSGTVPAAEAYQRSSEQYHELLPQGLATPGYSWRVLVVDGEPVADVWVTHAFSPGVAFIYSVETSPEHRGRGYGRAIMTVAGQVARAAGEHHIGLNVFGHNAVAIHLYTSMGYRVVEQSRLDPL